MGSAPTIRNEVIYGPVKDGCPWTGHGQLVTYDSLATMAREHIGRKCWVFDEQPAASLYAGKSYFVAT
jgi:hypothetical protein